MDVKLSMFKCKKEIKHALTKESSYIFDKLKMGNKNELVPCEIEYKNQQVEIKKWNPVCPDKSKRNLLMIKSKLD